MTITLDDVSSLFHLSINDRFWTTHVLSMPVVCMTVARHLGVSEADVKKEFDINMDTHLRMYWLRKTYDELVAVGSYEVAARMYMLHLVTCTLFADKSGVYVDTRYVFSSLEVTS